jgi:protein-tyrosine-phosphatase
MADGDVFDLVFICTANQFRSAVAEGFVAALVDDLPVRVGSVGIRAEEGIAPVAGAIAEAGELGVDIAGHLSRPLRPALVERADLVLGFEAIHVADAVIENGAPRGRTFTALEFADLAERVEPPILLDPVERARRVVAFADAARRTAAPDRAFDFPDPLAGPERDYPIVVEQIRDLSERIVNALF